MSDRLEPLSELVARVDLGTLVEHYSGAGRKVGARILYTCPNPAHPDRHPSFDVRRDPDGTERGRCRSACAWSGDALDLVQWVEGFDRSRAIDWLRTWTGTPDPARSRPTRPAPTPKPLAPLPETKPVPADAAGRIMAGYLASRGWPTEAEARYGLSVVSCRKSRRARVRHPFYVPGPEGLVLASWQDRATWDASRSDRWDSPAGRPLPPWNVTALEADDVTAAVICEGPADGITADLALSGLAGPAVVGIPGVNGWRDEWAPMFAGLLVVLVADNDDAGRKFRDRITPQLSEVAQVRTVDIATAKDLSALCAASGLEAVRRLLLTALETPDTPPRGGLPLMPDEVLEGLGTVADNGPAEAAEVPTPDALEPAAVTPAARRLTSAGSPCQVCGRGMVAGQGPRGAHYACRPEDGTTVHPCTCHPNPDYGGWIRAHVLPVNPDATLPAPCPVHHLEPVEVAA